MSPYRRILLFLLVLHPGLLHHSVLALDIVPTLVPAPSKVGHSALKSSSENESIKLDAGKDESTSAPNASSSGDLPQNKILERRMDHGEVTHGVGYGTHLDPQYYQGNHMGKYYDCALQGPWKPIHGHYQHRAPGTSGGVSQSNNMLQHVDHPHEHAGTSHHGGNSFGTNYLEEWDQRLKEVLQGPQENSGGAVHEDVAAGGGGHHSGGQEIGHNNGGYGVTSTGYGGSGTVPPYSEWEEYPEGPHSGKPVKEQQKGMKGGKESATIHSDFPYSFDSEKWHDWLHEAPYDGSSSNQEAHDGYPKYVEEEDHPELKAFHDAVKHVGDMRYTHAIFGLVGEPEGHHAEGNQGGVASQGFHGTAEGGNEEGFGQHGGHGGEEGSSGSGTHPSEHAAPTGGGGSYEVDDGLESEGVKGEEGEPSNESGELTSGGTGNGEETGDLNGGIMHAHGDLNAPYAEALKQPQPMLQSAHENSGTGYGGGQNSQPVAYPYSEGTEGSNGVGSGHQQTQNHFAPGGLLQYESPPPRCPYAHDHMHAHMANAIHSVPYDEGIHMNHLQVMLPPMPPSHMKLIPVLPLKQYEVYENQEESENKEIVAQEYERPNYIPAAYQGVERPPSGDETLQQGHADETFAEPNKVVDGSSHPAEQDDDGDFLRPPPPMVTDHYVKGNGNFVGFSDGRRKRRPLGRPSLHSIRPHGALFKRPPTYMMRARPMARGSVKRLSFV